MAGQTICRFHILNLTIGIFHTGTPQRRFHILWINIGGAAIILSPPENLQRVYRLLQQLAKIFGRRRCCLKCAILLDADDGRRCPADLVTLFMEYDEIYHLGLATLLQQVIRGTEGIELTSCDDFEGVSYLLYHPSCPWNRSDTDRRPIGCRSLASFLLRRKAPKHRKHIRQLLEQYRGLSSRGQESVRSVVGTLCAYRDEVESGPAEPEPRVIPLYRSPAAAGYAAQVFGEDFDYVEVSGDVPAAAEFAVRIQGDSMTPYIADGSVAYVNRDPLRLGDVGVFCVDGDILCKQYYKDPAGTVYLFSLNRARADADVVFTAGSGRTLVCFGRVILHAPPLPGRA